jgi:hypothetical protein
MSKRAESGEESIDRSPVAENTKVSVRPIVTTIPEPKIQLSIGILIGLGIALILIGSFGSVAVNYTYGTLKNFLLASGYDPNSYYLFRDLTGQIAIYLTLTAIGAVALLWCALILKSRAVKELLNSRGPHYKLGSGLIGGGGAIALSSMHSLFLYILASDYLDLEFFSVLFPVGVFLLACGILALRRK